MAEGFTLDAIVQFAIKAKDEGIKTAEAQERHIRSRLPVPTETQEELRAAFEEVLPGQNLILSDPAEIRARRLNHLNTYDIYIRLAAEYGSIERTRNTPREMGALYMLEKDQAAIDFNNHLREAFEKKDYAEVGRLYGEHIMNLPSFDPEMIETLSAAEAPGMLRELYPLYIAVVESKNFLGGKNEDILAIKAGMSKESLERLEELRQHESIFTTLKTRCDDMFSPYHPYVDTSKLACTKENANALMTYTPQNRSQELQQYFPKLGSNIFFTANGFGDDTARRLKNAGIDTEHVVAQDFRGKAYTLADSSGNDCGEVYMRSEPVFCTVGGQLKAFRIDGQTVVEVQPKEAMDSCFKDTLSTAIKNTDALMNGKVAAPRWMLTGSSQYRGMQKAYAAYQKAVNGEPSAEKLSDPEVMDALNALQPAAQAYFTLKGVDLDDYPDFDAFYNRAEMAVDMSERELARMMSAYEVMNTYRSTVAALKTQETLANYPSYREPLPVKLPYDRKVQQDVKTISESKFLNEPVEAVGNNRVGEALRQDVQTALTGPLNGLLNKKFFTAQDRRVAEDVLAKTVILSMIRSGRKAAVPSAIETSYMTNAEETIETIKNSTAFREAKGGIITPDGLRNFLTENRQAVVNRSIATDAVQQQKAANAEMQPQPQQLQQQMQVQQVQPQPQGMGGPPMV